MPARLIREELLASERYWSVSNDARLLFLHLILKADDFGLYSGANFAVRTQCFPGASASHEQIEALLEELNRADLIRLYEVLDARFIYIPRFRQFGRNKKSKYPVTPSIFNDLAQELQCIRHADDLHVYRSATAKTVVEVEVEVEVEEKNPPTPRKRGEAGTPDGFEEFWRAYPKKEAKQDALRAYAKLAPDKDLQARILSAVRARAQTKDWTKEEKKYVPLPASWLNGRRWEDQTGLSVAPPPKWWLAGGFETEADALSEWATPEKIAFFEGGKLKPGYKFTPVGNIYRVAQQEAA